MTIKIGEKIKFLRKKNDITQDRLAEYIGVTAQAISRWESGVCYPDIETLPAIADFFDVTLDELMCVDQSKKEKQIQVYIDEGHRLDELSLYDEACTLFRKAVSEFPSSFDLQAYLASYLFCKNDCDNPNQDELDESIAILNRIIEDCPDDDLRDHSKTELCTIYDQLGKHDKALEIANKMHCIFHSQQMVKATLLSGDVAFVEAQNTLLTFADTFWLITRNFVDSHLFPRDTYSVNDKIKIIEKCNKILELILEDNPLFYNTRFADNYRTLCWLHILNNDYDSALDALENSAHYALMFDNRPIEAAYTSLLTNRLTYRQHEYHEVKLSSNCQMLLDRLSRPAYDPIRDHERFKAVLENLSQQP